MYDNMIIGFMRQAIKVFKALSDPTRLRILMLLLNRELCVCELLFTLKMEQSRISHQLRILRDANLVEDIRDGKWTNYRIPEKTKKNLRAILDKTLKDNLSDSEEFEADRKNLQICLKENVRLKNRV
jgi:ArsR family transcriptional regulator